MLLPPLPPHLEDRHGGRIAEALGDVETLAIEVIAGRISRGELPSSTLNVHLT